MDTFPSTIYTGQDPNFPTFFASQLNHSLENNPDLFLLNETSPYSLAQIKELIHFFTIRPIKYPSKLAIILNASLLTVVCQNALLKILEEPGLNNYLLLVTNKPQNLLPTIQSRCHQINSPNTSQKIKTEPFPQEIKDKLIYSEEYAKDKENTIIFLEGQLQAYQEKLTKEPTLALAIQIKKILKSIDMVKHNVEPKSCLDWLLLA